MHVCNENDGNMHATKIYSNMLTIFSQTNIAFF